MSVASLGWAIVWLDLAIARLAPSVAPSLTVASWFAFGFGVVGFVAAIWGIRARRAWLLLLMVPFAANATLLLAPWVLARLRVVDAHVQAQEPRASQD